ncbi:hypothetical protein P872_21525 [Rhodonellum psychrophilum GCM71 = DSM 17998]|uniref:Glycosyl transferase family 1 domain-containing protein n=2 Tax=Rhodonellum TaxID=336827 RepID=U5BXN6_9BACT|nr:MULTISPECIES: glycosyltransferase [Rhodonellum]ERM80687.1 hypothetical protein P872_21525 [Rhodonellum psychrophilum GCM71 = DSM 17998]SDZ06741.1 Glycosyltransferase involved in cell wall bisynthesis [Rhodonellum ikkaensis]
MSIEKRKILFIGSFNKPINGHYGGVFFASITLRDSLIKSGLEIVEMDTTLKDISIAKVYKRIPSIVFRNFSFLFTIIKNHKSKFIFIFMSKGNSYIDKFPSILLSKVLGKKIIIFPRSGHLIKDNKNIFYRIFINLIFKLSYKIICQNIFWKDYFLANDIPYQKLVVIENWVEDEKIFNSSKLTPTAFNKKIDKVFKIIFVSRIEKEKGVDDLIFLAKKLQNQFNFIINVYGSGSYKDKFLDSISENNLENLVFYKGWLDKSIMLKTINTHHLAIFSSTIEGFPNSLLDYIFSKIPIISSDIPMIHAVGHDSILYFKPGNVDTLTNLVNSIYFDYENAIIRADKIFNEKLKKNNVDYAKSLLLTLLK